ncbi:hypothetical protein CCACVL1_10595 [Corchorus capsularis]|uniref:Uncharacterized protein n=1 Tax=Corchorus capsularis TaxID=210143 RepID=A0A1R3IQM2_COCAP|nr:hypothetical protein CCACVL1_10595 [Corchorus capsularis]
MAARGHIVSWRPQPQPQALQRHSAGHYKRFCVTSASCVAKVTQTAVSR